MTRRQYKTTAYQRSGYYERTIAELFEFDGYKVWQTRGSKSPADLICIKPGHVVLVQVKGGAVIDGHSPITHVGWNSLFQLATAVGAIPVLAFWPARGHPALRRITGEHVGHKTLWPSEPFLTDEAGEPRCPACGMPVIADGPDFWCPHCGQNVPWNAAMLPAGL